MYAKLLARDLAIVLVGVLIWRYAAPSSAGAGPASDVAGVVAGLLAGVCGYLVHEWGHLLGAFAAGSSVKPAQGLASGFLFSFDSRANTRQQFLAMTLGGWSATLGVVWAVYALPPFELFAARVARGVVLGNVLLVIVFEVPLVGYALLSGRVPRVETQQHSPVLEQPA